MDGIRFNIQADRRAFCAEIRGLNHPLEAADVHDDLIVHTHEGYGGDRTAEHAVFHRNNVHILGADYHVNSFVLAEAAISKDKITALSNENDLLKMQIKYKDEIISLHNYYNKLKPGD